MLFYLGASDATWLSDLDIPLLLPLEAFKNKKKDIPRGRGERWALDSGGYSELRQHGRWRLSPAEFADEVRRVIDGVGYPPDFVGPQDWVCSPPALEATGGTVAEHQIRTVGNLADLPSIAPEIPWLPTLQGWHAADYDAHVDMYAAKAINVTAAPLVGFGSIATRQQDPEVGRIARHLKAMGIRLHGFGIKKIGLRLYADALETSDSAAWSFTARYLRHPGQDPPARAYPECEAEFQRGEHTATCANCQRYATRWRDQVVAIAENRILDAEHPVLFAPDDTYVGDPRHDKSRPQVEPWPVHGDQLGLEAEMILVACGSAKLDRPARPVDLYTGSVFRAASRYAIGTGKGWVIISAKHGVLDPNGPMVDPYELSIDDLGQDARHIWGERVVRKIGYGPHTSLMGMAYDAPLLARGVQLDRPLEGLGMGYRLQWLTQRTHEPHEQEALWP